MEVIGHSQALVAAYPDLGVGRPRPVATEWGISRSVVRVTEPALTRIEALLLDVSSMFPGPWIHIGGDEVSFDEWDGSSETRERLRVLGISRSAELETWVARRLQRVLASHGKTLAGWDEITEGGTLPGAVITSWKGARAASAAAQGGHAVVVASMARTFLNYAADVKDPLASRTGLLRLEVLYNWDPIPPNLDSSNAARFLGIQSQLWTEFVPTQAAADRQLFPRLLAIAEIAWTNQENRDYTDFLGRLPWHYAKLRTLGHTVEAGSWPTQR